MTRTADSTIKGFLYQFHKTILVIASASEGDKITVEGLIEDIDVETLSGEISAVQCKYHEAASSFTESMIYKPILQMAESFSKSTTAARNVNYRIFIHVPSEAHGVRALSLQLLEAALATTDVKLAKIVTRIIAPLNKADLLSRVTLEFGPSIQTLENDVKIALESFAIPGADVDCILYPNAINHIAKLASTKNDNDRRITKGVLRQYLAGASATAISKWVLASQNKAKILAALRKQLSSGLAQNSRERFFYFSPTSIDYFDDEIVLFISNYIDKYGIKPLHTKVPLVAIDCPRVAIDELQYRLFRKNLKCSTGMIGTTFEMSELFREPMQKADRNRVVEKEFNLRLLATQPDIKVLNYRKAQDLFCVCDTIPSEIDRSDVNVFHVGVRNFRELEYTLNLRATYE